MRSELMGGREDGRYISHVMDMWNGRDLSVRNQASILSEIRNISSGYRLTEFEKSEIKNRVEREFSKGSPIFQDIDIDFRMPLVTQGFF